MSLIKSSQTGDKRFKFFHMTSFSLVALVPIGLWLSPSGFSFPIDTALAFLIPAHAHIGTKGIILDYVPRGLQTPSIWGLRVATGLAFLGLLKINQGSGVTAGLKQLWRPTPPKVASDKH